MAVIEGQKQLTAKIKKVQMAAANEIEQALVNSALIVERDAKIKAPVDTGRLRQSITHNLEPDPVNPYVEVGTNVEYAKHVEFGTSRQAAKPFLQPALVENKRAILKQLANAFKKGAGL